MTIRLMTFALVLTAFAFVSVVATAADEPAAIGEPDETPASTTLDDILSGYNASIDRAMTAIDTLRVEQELIEPQDDGGEKRASAILVYRRGEGMEREEIFSDLGHPVGEYTLESLVGPPIRRSEYQVALDGAELMEGRPCFRLALKAIERDTRHFDGTVWVDSDGFGLVRIVGEVADPPFPVRHISLDKTFEVVPEGFRLLRRHEGAIEIHLAFVTRKGVMDILYSDYSIGLAGVRPD